MALVTRDFTYSAGAVIVASQHNTNENTLYTLVNGNLNTSNLSASAGIVDTQLAQITSTNKVSVSSITAFSNLTTVTGVATDYIVISDTSDSGNNKKALASDFQSTAATQAEMEAASSTSVYVSPGRTQYHPGVAKAWINFNGTGTPAVITSYNMDSSITDNGTGDYTVNITTDFSSANYCAIGMAGTTRGYAYISAKAAGTFRVLCTDNNGATLIDQSDINIVFFGDQA